MVEQYNFAAIKTKNSDKISRQKLIFLKNVVSHTWIQSRGLPRGKSEEQHAPENQQHRNC